MNLAGFFAGLKKQEERYGIELLLSPDAIRDEKHLDCLWYGGEVGCIKYRNHFIVIGAHGEIKILGKINGEEIHYQDRDESGRLFSEMGTYIDDDLLHKLLDSKEAKNHLTLIDCNWFEVDLISPENKFIDLCDIDNILENNILDCFSNVSRYFEYVDKEIEAR